MNNEDLTPIRLKIDGIEVEAERGTKIIAAAKKIGIKIPHFCYQKSLLPVGTCRMCLVEIEGAPKLVTSCSTDVENGMKLWTQTEAVKKARRDMLEYILLDHPLDCPICDKAGECKLQDYYQIHGLFDSPYKEPKILREKKLKIAEDLILDRERCILCTRCVRFLEEVPRTSEFIVIDRGNYSEIGIRNDDLINNAYSGNLVDLCPVGAITNTDFRFKARVWFLKQTESICPHCSTGCNVYIESESDYFPTGKFKVTNTRLDEKCDEYGNTNLPKKLTEKSNQNFGERPRVYRILPRYNKDVNGDWICDIGRYGYKFIDKNRALFPMVAGEMFTEEKLGENLAQEQNESFRKNSNESFPEKRKDNPLETKSKNFKRIHWDNAFSLLNKMMSESEKEKILILIDLSRTNEEYGLIKEIFVESMGIKNIYFIGKKDRESDSILLKSDRNANRKGAENAFGQAFKLLSDKEIEKLRRKSFDLSIFVGKDSFSYFLMSEESEDSKAALNTKYIVWITSNVKKETFSNFYSSLKVKGSDGLVKSNVKTKLVLTQESIGVKPDTETIKSNVKPDTEMNDTEMNIKKQELTLLILPEATYAEKEGTFTNFEGKLQAIKKAVEPLAESKPLFHILERLKTHFSVSGLTFDFT